VKKILLVENSEALSKNIIYNLQGDGYTVLHTEVLSESYKILAESNISLIIADMGFDADQIIKFTTTISKDSNFKLIPFLMLSDEIKMNSYNGPKSVSKNQF
jgi:DNA-binding response OmpR family regulator